MKAYKLLKLENCKRYGRTQAQVVRISDGALMLDQPYQRSIATRYVKDFNDNTKTGIYLLSLYNESNA